MIQIIPYCLRQVGHLSPAQQIQQHLVHPAAHPNQQRKPPYIQGRISRSLKGILDRTNRLLTHLGTQQTAPQKLFLRPGIALRRGLSHEPCGHGRGQEVIFHLALKLHSQAAQFLISVRPDGPA